MRKLTLLAFLLLSMTTIAVADEQPATHTVTVEHKPGFDSFFSESFWEELWHRICYGRGRSETRTLTIQCDVPTDPGPGRICDDPWNGNGNGGPYDDIGPGTAPAPEPCTLLALAAGGGAVALMHRRRRRRNEGDDNS
jgi:hypothetical protein